MSIEIYHECKNDNNGIKITHSYIKLHETLIENTHDLNRLLCLVLEKNFDHSYQLDSYEHLLKDLYSKMYHYKETMQGFINDFIFCLK